MRSAPPPRIEPVTVFMADRCAQGLQPISITSHRGDEVELPERPVVHRIQCWKLTPGRSTRAARARSSATSDTSAPTTDEHRAASGA